MSSLADKLKSLGVKTASSLSLRLVVGHTIDSVVAGTFRATPQGEAFVTEQTFGEDYLHGNTSHLLRSPLSLISEWANEPRMAELPVSKFAFLDTETSGMAGGTGTYAFLVGVARFIDDKFVVTAIFFTRSRRRTRHA